jgi:hypothetical protein
MSTRDLDDIIGMLLLEKRNDLETSERSLAKRVGGPECTKVFRGSWNDSL